MSWDRSPSSTKSLESLRNRGSDDGVFYLRQLLATETDVCLLHRKPNTSNAYWEQWNLFAQSAIEKVSRCDASSRESTEREV